MCVYLCGCLCMYVCMRMCLCVCADLYYRTILLSNFVEIRYCVNALALFSFAINVYLNLPYNLSFYVRMCISMYMYVHVMFVYINVFIHIANAHYLLFRTMFQKD